MGIDVNVNDILSTKSTAIQQMVSIARAISINAKLVVLDEPTSSLDSSEVQILFQVIRDLKARGISVIFITHRLDEVFEMSDEMSILNRITSYNVCYTKLLRLNVALTRSRR